MPARFLINQCQIITFLILKSDITENSRIELRGIVLPAPSNHQIKVTFIIILSFNLVHFSCFTKKLKEKVGGLLGGQSVCWPPLSNYWGGGGGGGGGGLAPPGPSSSYAYDMEKRL